MENLSPEINCAAREAVDIDLYPLPREFFLENGNEYSLESNGEKILFATDGPSITQACFEALCGQDDIVVYYSPCWSTAEYIRQVGARGRKLETREEHNFLPLPSKLKPMLKDAVLLCLCSPVNPAGAVLPEHQIREICTMIQEENKSRLPGQKKLHLFFDAMHSPVFFRKEAVIPFSSFSSIREYTIYAEATHGVFSPADIAWCRAAVPVLERIEEILQKRELVPSVLKQQKVTQLIRNIIEYGSATYNFQQVLIEAMTVFHVGIYGMKFNGYPVQTLGPSFHGGMYLSVKIDIIGKMLPDGQFLALAKDVSEYLKQSTGAEFLPFSVFDCADTLPWFSLNVGKYMPEEIPVLLKSLQSALEFAKGFGLYSGI